MLTDKVLHLLAIPKPYKF